MAIYFYNPSQIYAVFIVSIFISICPLNDGQKHQQQRQQQKEPPQGTNNKMCPLDEHVVCNENEKDFRCVCTMFGSIDPPPEQSCTNLLNFTGYRGDTFEAVSAKLRLKPTFFPKMPPNTTTSSNWADNYMEEKFKSQLAWNFKIQQKNIIFLRLRCLDTDDVIVQFVVLRKTRRRVAPLSKKDLVSANTVVSRLRGMRDMQRIGGMDIMHVEKVYELLPVEVDIDNTRLATQAIVVGLFIILTCICGCWVSCRRRSPEDEGYADVVQDPEKV